jgi:hypothetical protein
MNWDTERHHLAEQLAILKKPRTRFGEAAIEIASQERLEVHKTWIQKWSQKGIRGLRDTGSDHAGVDTGGYGVGPSSMINCRGFRSKTGPFFGLKSMFSGSKRAV